MGTLNFMVLLDFKGLDKLERRTGVTAKEFNIDILARLVIHLS